MNNAGFGSRGRFFEAPFEDQARMHRVHIDAILRLTHAVLGGMVQHNEGGVINVSSLAAFAQPRQRQLLRHQILDQRFHRGCLPGPARRGLEGQGYRRTAPASPIRSSTMCWVSTAAQFRGGYG